MADPLPVPPTDPAPSDPAAESARIAPAAAAVAEKLNQRATRVTGEAKQVLETTAIMAIDTALTTGAEELVVNQSLPAARAVHDTANGFADAFAQAGEYMAERVRDMHDVRDRIVAELLGIQPPGVPALDEPSILLARDLAPADTADLDPAKVLALVTEEGGPTSHTAILARSLGIPAVVGVRELLSVPDVVGLIVDGDLGTVELSDRPVPVVAADRATPAAWNGIGSTSDGHEVKVVANVGSASDAKAAVEAGAQGVGLFRTEFCYLAAESEPSVATQHAAYAEILSPFADQPVVVRTLDAGADKPLPFLEMPAEANPALGVRGVRISRETPEVLDRQLEAIAAATEDTRAKVSVMAPMIATADEAAWFAERVRAAGLSSPGVMIETPAAALTAREILEVVDFVSIGTNDLAQYVFAADRMLGTLAALNDPWQPALLRLIEHICRAGAETGKSVGVCGEAAGDPDLAGILVGLGVRSLSMVAAAVPATGAALAEHTLADFQQAAAAVVATGSTEAARAAARAALG